MIWPHIPEHISPWFYFTCIGLSVLITGISKSGFGGGVGILAIPLMAVAMDDARAMTGVTLPLLIACDILCNFHYFKEYDLKRLAWMLPGAFAGVAVGTIILYFLNQHPPAELTRTMNLIVGSICLVAVAMQMYRLTGREIPTLPPHPLSGASVGLIAATVSTINHTAGPILQAYMLQERLEKRIMVGTLVLYTLIMNAAKVPTYMAMNIINAQTLRDSVWFIPLIPVGTLAGAWLNRRINEKAFMATMYIATAVTAGYMVFKAVMH